MNLSDKRSPPSPLNKELGAGNDQGSFCSGQSKDARGPRGYENRTLHGTYLLALQGRELGLDIEVSAWRRG